MLKRTDQEIMENKAKNFILNLGSPVTAQSLSEDINRQWHTGNNLLNRFVNNNLLTKIPIGKITAFKPTKKLAEIDFTQYTWKKRRLIKKPTKLQQ